MPSRNLSDMLGNKPSRPDIRRGPGFHLSTEDEARNLESEKSSKKQPAQAVVRKKLGWTVRPDLIKRFKQLAVNQDRDAYELLEEAMEAYLATHSHAQ